MRPFKKVYSRSPFWISLSVLLVVGCGNQQFWRFTDDRKLPEKVDFNVHVKPLLSDRCYPCHGPDSNAREANLHLYKKEGAFAPLDSDTSKYAIVPGNLRTSELIKRISSTQEDFRMPPPESNLALSDYEVGLMTRWVKQGAEWKPHWAFIPPDRPELPRIRMRHWATNQIDYFTMARMEEQRLTPSQEATKEKLIRRVSFDLTGLPPSLMEIDTFVDDDSPDAYENVVDRLLASEAFGERMASEWLDVARYADTHGFQDDRPRSMWPWRDWVIEAFNSNLSYDKFVEWQVAGDLHPDATYEQKLATGFNRNHPITQEGGVVEEEYRIEYVADRTQTTSTAFLGITMKCARCHDHKFDLISQEEYYQTFAFFNHLDERGMIDYITEAPAPSMKLRSKKVEEKLEDLRYQVLEKARYLEASKDNYTPEFRDWVDQADIGNSIRSAQRFGLAGAYDLDNILREDQDNESGSYLIENRVDASLPARLNESAIHGMTKLLSLPRLVQGKKGSALQFDGGNFLDLGDMGDFDRTDEFSVSFWMRIKEPPEKNAYVFSKNDVNMFGSRGHNLVLTKSGRLRFDLIHFRKELSEKGDDSIDTVKYEIPGDLADALEAESYSVLIDNKAKVFSGLEVIRLVKGKVKGYQGEDILGAVNNSKNSKHRKYIIDEIVKQVKKLTSSNLIRVTTKSPIIFERWQHVLIGYDGSSVAEGVTISLDGALQDLDVNYDNLTGTTLTGVSWYFGNWSDLKFGDPFGRDADYMGIANGSIDELKIYDRQLTDVEITALANLEGSGEFSGKSYDTMSDVGLSKLNEFYLYHYSGKYNQLLNELKSLRKRDFMVPHVMIMDDIDSLRDTYVLSRGAYDAPTKKVEPGTPAAIFPFPDEYPKNRLGFAMWLTDRRNPLTARVTVNRYWQMILGKGIVSTPDDFGSQGSFPTHPMLLDWLAVEFMESGWDLKGLLKKMVMSSTYRQSSRITPQSLEKDPENTYYARGPNQRLTAEMMRDHVLAISGLLNGEIGGPPVKPYQPEGVWKAVANTIGEYKYRQSLGNHLYRRSLYTYWKRTIPPPSMITLDASTRNTCTVQRQATNTPLQSLVLLNDPQYVEASRVLAGKMMSEGGSAVEDRIILAFRLATSRMPSEGELDELVELYQQQMAYYNERPDEAVKLVSVGDSPRNKELDSTRLASFTIIAGTIINLDESVKKG